MIEIKAVPGKLIMLGKQGENLAREVVFDVSGVRAEFGDGAFRLSAKRPGESDAYPATITETGDTVVWVLTGADTQNAGRGQCELAYYAGETRLKTWTYDTAIAKSLTGSPKTDPYDEFLDEVNRLAAEAAISQREAKNSENAAKNSEENAKVSEGAAKTSEGNAAEYAQAALAAEKKSEQNAGYAASAATAAGQYAQNAATSATNADNSATNAETHEKGAKDAAAAAAKSAEGLADAVKRAEDAATAAQDNAGKTAADREAVAEMKTAAETAKGDAEKSATSAAGSATAAGESATAAETSRTGAAEIKAQIDTTKGEIDQAKADIDQTKTDTLAAKTAAETAATTATEKATEIADSAAQIATNTENIENNAEDIDLLRRENTELRAKTDALWKLSEGKSYDFVEDSTEAYSKNVPTGCRFAQVEKIGGKTVARNAGELVSAGVTDVEVGFPEQSGSTVTISDGIDGHALDITASWTPTQAGSGDPSPENIRPISGRDKITLTRTAGSDVQTSTLSLPETIYGGSVDAATGEGMMTWSLITLDGTEDGWYKYGGADVNAKTSCFAIGISDKAYGFGSSICNLFCNTNDSSPYISDRMKAYNYTDHPNLPNIYMNFGVDSTVTVADWKSYLAAQKAAGTPVTIAYKLASPTAFTATGAKTITAKSGVNTVFSDAGNVKVKYSDDIYPIPDAVKALPGYGWSAGNLYNAIVRRADGWDYIQRVGLPATADGYTALNTPTTTDITDLMTGALPLVTTEPGGTITMHHALADDGLTIDVPNTVKYIRDLKEVASSGTE